MALDFVRDQGFHFNTMSYRFVLRDPNTGAELPCAVSREAMDDAEHVQGVPNGEREAQFERLKDRIVDCASRKFLLGHIEDGEPRVLVKSADLNQI